MELKINFLRDQFISIDVRSRTLIERIPEEHLYSRPRELPNSLMMFSCGEYILRSAAVVEQVFGGLTTKLWDDPFEWTLPEKLFSKDLVLEYLADVKSTTDNGFKFLNSDADLDMHLPAPKTLRPIFEILVEAIAKAEHFQGRAFALFRFLSDEKLPDR